VVAAVTFSSHKSPATRENRAVTVPAISPDHPHSYSSVTGRKGGKLPAPGLDKSALQSPRADATPHTASAISTAQNAKHFRKSKVSKCV
jgi:hypothetical protein